MTLTALTPSGRLLTKLQISIFSDINKSAYIEEVVHLMPCYLPPFESQQNQRAGSGLQQEMVMLLLKFPCRLYCSGESEQLQSTSMFGSQKIISGTCTFTVWLPRLGSGSTTPCEAAKEVQGVLWDPKYFLYNCN